VILCVRRHPTTTLFPYTTLFRSVAGWEKRSGELRQRYPAHIDLRYGPRERNRIDFLKAADKAPTLLFIHGGYWQARSKEVFTVRSEEHTSELQSRSDLVCRLLLE